MENTKIHITLPIDDAQRRQLTRITQRYNASLGAVYSEEDMLAALVALDLQRLLDDMDTDEL